MSTITHYTLTVHRGERAGLVRHYSDRRQATRFADRLDNEYGAICCSVRPVFAAGPSINIRKCAGCDGYHVGSCA